MHRQILGYLPANVIPALISVATIYVFTRLLPPAAFGLYTVGFNAVMFVQGAVFIALPLAVMRFLPAALRDGTQAALLSTAWADFALVCAPLAGAGLGLLLVLPMDPDIRAILLVALPALALRAVVAMSQAQARACNAVLRYGVVECLQSSAGFAAGVALILWRGPAGMNAVLGVLVGAALAAAAGAPATLRLMRGSAATARPGLRHELRAFTLPLAGSYVVIFLLQYADRFLLDMFAGAGVLGVYAVAFSLVERPTTLLCQLISTATFPMAVRALEHEGAAAARTQNGHNGAALLGLALPACIGLALCADQIAAVLAGPAYRGGVASLIPPLAVAALLRNIAAHYLDHSFHLLRRSDLLLAIYAPASAGNIALDMVLIPRFGMMGAAYASLIALSSACFAGIVIGHRQFGLWLPAGRIARILVASLIMAAVLMLFHPSPGAAGLLAKIAAGAGTYAAMAAALDIGGIHALVRRARPLPKPVNERGTRPELPACEGTLPMPGSQGRAPAVPLRLRSASPPGPQTLLP